MPSARMKASSTSAGVLAGKAHRGGDDHLALGIGARLFQRITAGSMTQEV